MRASKFFASAALAAAASAQSSSSSSVDAYPQTSLLKEINSLGVVTGMFPVATSIPDQPAVVTSQPALVTSQPAPANIPAVGPGLHTLVLPGTGSLFNSTRTVVVSANNSTTIVIQTSTTPSASPTGSAGASGHAGSAAKSGATGTPTGTAGGSQSSKGAAANVKVAAGSVMGFGAFVAAFL
ncbi:hypothetical protein ACEQ8H_005342 [Pleosporales sp. CAS-2024a]